MTLLPGQLAVMADESAARADARRRTSQRRTRHSFTGQEWISLDDGPLQQTDENGELRDGEDA